MSEQNVPIVRTVIDMRMYARAVARAWRQEFGDFPTKGQTGVLYAQYGIETGGGANAACWNWNIGNVKHVPGDGHDYFMLPNTFEFVSGKRITYQPPDPATWFRSFESLDIAMREHFAFLRGKYASCWVGVELEDVGVFARKLKEGPDGKENTRDDYYTADANAYAAGMRAHFTRFMQSDAFEKAMAEIAEADNRPTLPAPPDEDAPVTIDGGTIHPDVPLPEIPDREYE